MSINKNDPNVARESKNNPFRNVAVVGLLNDNEEILLVRTKRFPEHWQPIGGGVKEFDQSPAHTLQRELEEETKIKLELDAFQKTIVTSYDFGEGRVHFYTAKMPKKIEPVFDTEELAEWKWFSLPEALHQSMFPATKKFLNKLSKDQVIS